MALRILQFSVLFAIGFHFGPISLLAGALDTPEIALSLNLTDPADVIVQKGQSATLRCDVKSSLPGLKISWLHNNAPIPLNDSRWSLQRNGSLHIPRVVSGKKSNGVTGDYQCLVKNKAGALLSGVAKLKVATMEKDFTKNPNTLSVAESQPALLRCSIHSTPPAEIQWEFNNQPLPQNTRNVPLPSGALLISNSHSSDAGSYRCKATNNILNKTKYSKTAVLTVSSPLTEARAPAFLPLDISLNNTVYVGENLNLYCAVMGWPKPTLQWLNNDSVIIGNSTVLRILKTQPQHAGNYTCVAYNNVDRISQNYRVEVLQKPYFNDTPVSKSYPAAKTVRLDCHALGIPDPRIYWLKDGEPLTTDPRIKKQSSGLVFSHTFNRDSGIYQCMAVNSAGKIWSAAQIEINVSLSPSPPENVQCRPYDATSVCITWTVPRNISFQAFSVHSSYRAQGVEVLGPDGVSEVPYKLMDRLMNSTNYTFYVRSYSKGASDSSERVTCKSDVKGSRNLDIVTINSNSVTLEWSEISSDVPCGEAKGPYKIQWRREGHSTINVERTLQLKHNITGLIPGTDYEFRVSSTSYDKDAITAPWILYTFPEHRNGTITDVNNDTDTTPPTPRQLEGTPVSPDSIKLTWQDIDNKKFYTVCYVLVKDGRKCEDGKLIKSFSNKMVAVKLKSNNLYEFKVRAHNFEGTPGPFSKSIEVQTPADVPSPVSDLMYKVVNDTTVCLRWQAPANKNGNIQKYIISYTPDRNLPPDKWTDVSVPSYQRKSTACWLGDQDMISTFLGNLSSGIQYMVIVRALSDVGMANPTKPLMVATTSSGSAGDELDQQIPNLQKEIEYHKRVGIIIGVILALICIVCCITCILVRRRCLKRRALARARMAASNNYYPAVAHYASHVGSVQVRLEDPCVANVHEIQHLVSDTHSTHIPPISPSHLDTKGGEEFPNGHVNGSAKPYMNGHMPNGHVHITENPQYYAFECNGHVGTKKSKQPSTIPLRFEEDSNSNVKSSKFYDLYRLFESSKKSNPNYHQCNPHFEQNVSKSQNCINDVQSMDSSEEASLNDTQLTCLDDSLGLSVVNNHRRISPILGPNG